jgi:zinc transporter ZupT
MEEFIRFILMIVVLSILAGLILCLYLAMFSSRLKPLWYASIISFVIVIGVVIIEFQLNDFNRTASAYLDLILYPGLLIALPIIYILGVPHGPCSSIEPLYVIIFVSSFIFYTLLIFGIIKLWYLFKKHSLQKNGDKQGRPPISEAN